MTLPGGDGRATVRLERERAPWMHRFASYKVILDGEKVARIRDGETVEFTVEAGEHQLWIVGWAKTALSDAQTFRAKGGRTLVFTCRPNPRFLFRHSEREVNIERRHP